VDRSQVAGLFKQHQLTDISVIYHTVTVHFAFLQLLLGGHVVRAVSADTISGDEADLWWTDLARASREGTFLYGFTAVIVAGTKN
jgi:hypothetical protein